jgi:hypothetical protein
MLTKFCRPLLLSTGSPASSAIRSGPSSLLSNFLVRTASSNSTRTGSVRFLSVRSVAVELGMQSFRWRIPHKPVNGDETSARGRFSQRSLIRSMANTVERSTFVASRSMARTRSGELSTVSSERSAKSGSMVLCTRIVVQILLREDRCYWTLHVLLRFTHLWIQQRIHRLVVRFH